MANERQSQQVIIPGCDLRRTVGGRGVLDACRSTLEGHSKLGVRLSSGSNQKEVISYLKGMVRN